jgi:hypothetical protein
MLIPEAQNMRTERPKLSILILQGSPRKQDTGPYSLLTLLQVLQAKNKTP